jgi:hypothetical protein
LVEIFPNQSMGGGIGTLSVPGSIFAQILGISHTRSPPRTLLRQRFVPSKQRGDGFAALPVSE